MPTGKSLAHAVAEGARIGCTALQVFTTNPQQWRSKKYAPDDFVAFRGAVREANIGSTMSHDRYLTNLASVSDEIRAKSLEGLKAELARCSELGIGLVVCHMGAHMGRGREEGEKLLAEGAREVLAETPPDVKLLMETMEGGGSTLNSTFEAMARVMDLVGRPERLRVCLDTCHVFSAGYDLRDEESYERTWDEFDRLIGLSNLAAIHANDSKFGLGTHKDRHAHLGEGEIGEAAFARLMKDPRFFDVPIVIETPEAETMHETNVARLWEWSEA